MKNSIAMVLVLCLLNLNCQSQSNKKVSKDVKETSLDLLEVNFKTDLKKVIDFARFNTKESEFSEYLNSFETKEVNGFTLAGFQIESKTLVKGFEVPNNNYISLVTKNKETNKVLSIHLKLNYLKSKKAVLDMITDKLGAPKSLNSSNSINTLKGRENYIWKNYKDNKTAIISFFSEGSIVSIEENSPSEKVYSALIYLIDNDDVIDYPNGQKENILERLEGRFSS